MRSRREGRSFRVARPSGIVCLRRARCWGRLPRLRPAGWLPLVWLAPLLWGIAGSLPAVSPAIAGPAESAYRRGDLEKARRLYEERLHREPGDLRARYNMGNVLYRSQQLKAAEEAYQATLGSPDPVLRGRAAHNLGNARLQAGEIDGAVAAYVEALRAQPESQDTKYNLELALRLRQMKQQEQQQQQGRGQQDENRQPNQQDQGQKQQQAERSNEQQGRQDQKQPQDAPGQPKEGEQDQKSPEQAQAKEDRAPNGEQQMPPPAPGDYTEKEAERVLDGLAQEERDLLADRWRSLGRDIRVEKDW